ncbi:MAG TPA: kelch repeat-containing protein [Verrucomicrobiae bacterium]|nr:kelch repeat-containing protein [Verrucomicrobiae bacterium]
MKKPRQTQVCLALAGGILTSVIQTAFGQTTDATLAIFRNTGNVIVSWTGSGTLQSATVPQGPWQDVLEAPNPFAATPSNTHGFYRTISRWGTRSDLLAANSEMAVAELNGKIYVIGGYPSSRFTVPTVQVYDPVQDRWALTTPLPIALNHEMAAGVNAKLYVIGGQTDSGNTSFVNNVFEFDPSTTNWSPKATMPTARSAGAAAVIGNLIYVAGGRPPRGQDFAVYDTVNNQWTTLTNMPTPRNHIAAAAIDGKVYVAGGRLGAGFTSTMTNVLEVYDPATGLWSTQAPMPTTRGGVNGIAVDGCFFVWGGEGPNGVFHENEMFVPALNRWYRLESLPIHIHGVTGAAFVNGWIHAPGGGTDVGGSSGSTIHQVFWVGGICSQFHTGGQ